MTLSILAAGIAVGLLFLFGLPLLVAAGEVLLHV